MLLWANKKIYVNIEKAKIWLRQQRICIGWIATNCFFVLTKQFSRYRLTAAMNFYWMMLEVVVDLCQKWLFSLVKGLIITMIRGCNRPWLGVVLPSRERCSGRRLCNFSLSFPLSLFRNSLWSSFFYALIVTTMSKKKTTKMNFEKVKVEVEVKSYTYNHPPGIILKWMLEGLIDRCLGVIIDHRIFFIKGEIF